LFCHRVLKALQQRNLISDTVVAQILGQRHSGFSAWLGEEIASGDESYRLFLARYIDRGPVADARIEIQDDVVTYRTEKDGLTHEFSPLEFLARLTPHVPDKWESTIRYYGYYSHRARGERKKQQAMLHKAAFDFDQLHILPVAPEEKRKASRSWAALIKRVFEIEPLLCEKCGSSMRIKAFITDPAEVKRLLNHLKIPGFEKPLPISGPSPPLRVVLEPEFVFPQ
jgi:hypothetical protein